MILYLGDRGIFDYLNESGVPLVYSNTLKNAEKLIISEYSDQAVRLIKEAILVNIPVLGILDGFKSIIEAFDGRCEEINCAEGKQEFAVIDADIPIFKGLETVIKICRGKPFGIPEAVMPSELDAITRSNEGDTLAVSNLISPDKHGNIYGLNFHLASNLTPDSERIVQNFINL